MQTEANCPKCGRTYRVLAGSKTAYCPICDNEFFADGRNANHGPAPSNRKKIFGFLVCIGLIFAFLGVLNWYEKVRQRKEVIAIRVKWWKDKFGITIDPGKYEETMQRMRREGEETRRRLQFENDIRRMHAEVLSRIESAERAHNDETESRLRWMKLEQDSENDRLQHEQWSADWDLHRAQEQAQWDAESRLQQQQYELDRIRSKQEDATRQMTDEMERMNRNRLLRAY